MEWAKRTRKSWANRIYCVFSASILITIGIRFGRLPSVDLAAYQSLGPWQLSETIQSPLASGCDAVQLVSHSLTCESDRHLCTVHLRYSVALGTCQELKLLAQKTEPGSPDATELDEINVDWEVVAPPSQTTRNILCKAPPIHVPLGPETVIIPQLTAATETEQPVTCFRQAEVLVPPLSVSVIDPKQTLVEVIGDSSGQPWSLSTEPQAMRAGVNYIFTIHPRDNRSVPLLAKPGADHVVFFVDIEGPQKMHVRTKAAVPANLNPSIPAARYQFSTIFSIPGHYTVRIGVLEYWMESANCHITANCEPSGNAAQLHGSPYALQVQHASPHVTPDAQGLPMYESAAAPVLDPSALPHCTTMRDSFFGSFVTAGSMVEDAYSALDKYMRQHHDASFHRKPAEMMAWQPYHCRVPLLSPHELCEKLRGKWIVFLGDSTIEETAIALLLIGLGVEFDERWRDPAALDCGAKSHLSARTFDTNNSYNEQLHQHGIRVTMLWNAHPKTCSNGGGLAAMFGNNASFWRQIQARLREGDRMPDTIVYNSGLHDMGMAFSTSAFLQQLRTVLTTLKGQARVVWRSIAPKHHNAQTSCRGSKYPFPGGQGCVDSLNAAAASLAEELDIDIWDHHGMAYLMPPGSIVNHHCGGGAFFEEGRRKPQTYSPLCIYSLFAAIPFL